MHRHLRLVADNSGGCFTRKGKVVRPVFDLVSFGKRHEKPGGVPRDLPPYRPHTNGIRRSDRMPGILQALEHRLPSAKLFDNRKILHSDATMNKSFSFDKNILYMAWAGVIANNVFVTNIGAKLRERARELGLTDAAVARAAGLDVRRYGHYVENSREPKYDVLLKICGVLKCTPDYLLGIAPLPRPLETPGPVDMAAINKELFQQVLAEIFAAHQEAGTDTPLDEVVMEATDEMRSLLSRCASEEDIGREIAALRPVYVRLLARERFKESAAGMDGKKSGAV